MNLSDELTRLASLRDKGILTPAEFDKAKRKLLDSPDGTRPRTDHRLELEGGGQESLGKAANRYVSFRIVMTFIGFILFVAFAGPIMCSSRSPFGGAPPFRHVP